MSALQTARVLDAGEDQWRIAVDAVPEANLQFKHASLGYRRGVGRGLEVGGWWTWKTGAALEGKLRLVDRDAFAVGIGLGVDYEWLNDSAPLFTYRDQSYDVNAIGYGLGIQAPLYISYDLWPVFSVYGAMTPRWQTLDGSLGISVPIEGSDSEATFTISNDIRALGMGWTLGSRVGGERFGVMMEVSRVHYTPLGGYTFPIEARWSAVSGAVYF